MAAARGGEEGRIFPWSAPATSTAIDCTYANYFWCTPGLDIVGSRSPKGDGKFGHADLFGNAKEFVFDSTRPESGTDVAIIGAEHYTLGGSFQTEGTTDVPWYYSTNSSHRADFGIRCARVP